jgi:hypothetical protein
MQRKWKCRHPRRRLTVFRVLLKAIQTFITNVIFQTNNLKSLLRRPAIYDLHKNLNETAQLRSMFNWSEYHLCLVRGNMLQSEAMNGTYHARKVLRTSLLLHAYSIQIMLALRHDRALLYAFAIDILERLDEDSGHADLTRVIFIDKGIFHASWKVSRHSISFRRSEKPHVVLRCCRISYSVTYKW